jgi:hypothetical protein
MVQRLEAKVELLATEPKHNLDPTSTHRRWHPPSRFGRSYLGLVQRDHVLRRPAPVVPHRPPGACFAFQLPKLCRQLGVLFRAPSLYLVAQMPCLGLQCA